VAAKATQADVPPSTPIGQALAAEQIFRWSARRGSPLLLLGAGESCRRQAANEGSVERGPSWQAEAAEEREREGETELIINESFPATCHLSTVGENNSVFPHNKSAGKFACSGQKELRN
jgi:hypothetical protein